MKEETPTALSAKKLIAHCEEIFTTFDDKIGRLAAHAESYFSKHKIANQDDVTFVTQVAYGCVRCKRLIKALLNSFYHANR